MGSNAFGSTPFVSTAIRVLGAAGAAAGLFALAAVAYLDTVVGPSSGDRRRSTISAYVHTDEGWVFTSALAALVIGGGCIVVALVRSGVARLGSAGIGLLLASLMALLAVAVFPKTDWSVGDTWQGQLHRAASLAAFLLAPAGIIALTRRGAGGRPHLLRRAAFWCAVAGLGWLSPLVIAVISMPFTQRPWWSSVPLGTLERGVAGAEVAALVALGLWLALTPPTSQNRPARFAK